jgi:uncharacterized protein
MLTDPMQVWSSFLISPEAPKTSLSTLELDGYLTGIIVTPQAAPILPSNWIARLWGESEPIFEDKAQIDGVLGAVLTHYNRLLHDIDRSLKRLEADRIVDYRPMFLVGDEKPRHDVVRAWVRGLWKAMQLAPQAWQGLLEDKRSKVILEPFVGFFEIGELEPHEIRDDIDERLDQDAALIPRMILILRKLARIREAASRPGSAVRAQRTKIGRNDPCPCGSGKKYKRCCALA